MKDMTKIVMFAILVLALSPFAGFWIVALIGTGLLLLPVGAVFAKFFPAAWRRVEDSVLAKTHLLPTA